MKKPFQIAMHFPKRKVFLVLMLHSSVAIASLKDSCERLCRVICFCSTTEICGLLNALFLSLIFVVVVSCYCCQGRCHCAVISRRVMKVACIYNSFCIFHERLDRKSIRSTRKRNFQDEISLTAVRNLLQSTP